MKLSKNKTLGIIILIAFILLILTITLYFNSNMKIKKEQTIKDRKILVKNYLATCDSNTDMTTCKFIEPNRFKDNIEEFKRPFTFKYHLYIIPLSAFIGLLFGIIVYWGFSEKINKTEKDLRYNTEHILKLLPKTHRQIIQKLLENNGDIRQYELVNLTDLNKIKIHRILRDLENDEIIKKEKIGKINKIILNKEIYNALKE